MNKRAALLILILSAISCSHAQADMWQGGFGGRVSESIAAVPPRIEPNFPQPEERILMYKPGILSEFTVSAHWIHGEGELVAAYVMIYHDTLTASQALTGICRTLTNNDLRWTFAVDARDLPKPGEYVMTVIGWDSYGLAAELTFPMELYWEE